MRIEHRVLLCNMLMGLGMVPYALTLAYLFWMLTARGDAAIGPVFILVFGLGVSYLAALVIAWPAALWSSVLATAIGRRTRTTAILRWLAMIGVFPAFAIFPAILFGLLG
jgi:hypothetical protein